MAKDLTSIADRLIAAYDTATSLPPITAEAPDFSVADGYAVLADIEARRRAQGWRAVGRKIGFTNRTIWPRYGVHQPMWAHVWSHTVHFAKDGRATFDLKSFVLPRIEPEVVFKLKGPISASDDPLAVLAATTGASTAQTLAALPTPSPAAPTLAAARPLPAWAAAVAAS